jgi:hypothetical protein
VPSLSRLTLREAQAKGKFFRRQKFAFLRNKPTKIHRISKKILVQK